MPSKPIIRDIFDAAGVGDVDAVERFLAAGVDPNILDSASLPPIHLAAYVGHLEVVRVLIRAGARLDMYSAGLGYGVLMAVAHEGRVEIAQLLIDNGADVNARSRVGTALSIASRYSPDPRMLTVLILGGADVNPRSPGDFVPLVAAVCSGSVDNIKVLLEAGADVDCQIEGRNALDFAVERGKPAAAEYLTKIMSGDETA